MQRDLPRTKGAAAVAQTGRRTGPPVDAANRRLEIGREPPLARGRRYARQVPRVRVAWAAAALGVVLASGCGDEQALAERICDRHVECGIQFVAYFESDRPRCVDRYVELFTVDELEDCAVCHVDETCDELIAGACWAECTTE